MNYIEMSEAVNNARRTQFAFEAHITDLAKLLVGNLRVVNKDGLWSADQVLIDLKRELTQFNANTRTWKS